MSRPSIITTGEPSASAPAAAAPADSGEEEEDEGDSNAVHLHKTLSTTVGKTLRFDAFREM